MEKRIRRARKTIAISGIIASSVPFAALGFLGLASPALAQSATPACPGDDPGITLSPGFCATIFADNIGHVRHMAFAPNGVLYVNTWSGRYFRYDTPPAGGFVVALKDSKSTGKADIIERFGDGVPEGSAGGSGVAFYKDHVYAEQNDKIIRYAIPEDSIVPKDKPEVVVSGLPLTGDHPMHPFVIDPAGNLYVDLGSATNSCQVDNRKTGSPGIDPCVELETRGGTWRYDANKIGQVFSPAERFATGLRNGEGFSFDAAGKLYATQHGRDQLSQHWPALYKTADGAELPAEEIVQENQGDDFGWPKCYFDGAQKKLVLAPEYGGDGGKTVGLCAEKKAPVAFFPAHWAPNDVLVYTGTAFPEPYQGGLFIAFKGSWNRAPAVQAGYDVVFQPMKDGKTTGDYVVFADGFAGAIKEPARATYRPGGLAMGPDGALYIADDQKGRIWRVTYQGGADAKIAPAPAPKVVAAAVNDAVLDVAALPVPAGATRDQLVMGEKIFHGQMSDGTCTGCHGSDAKGTPQGPSLVSGNFVQGAGGQGSGTLEAITKAITEGVAKPRNFSDPMPPRGGAPLSDSDVAAVAAYVWAISHPKGV
jgi:glucose/arabinose dehydrogenase/cytochrome c5